VKLLLVLGGISIAIVVGLSFYADGMMDEVRERQQKFEAEFESLANSLRALPAGEDESAWAAFDAASFEQWLAIRTPLAALLDRRFAESPADRYFHQHETRHMALDQLRTSLAGTKLSLGGYVARCDRWLALLAGAGDGGLIAAYRERTRSRTEPEGSPLPPPGGGETELELLRLHRERVRASLSADLLLPPLRQILKVKAP